MRTLVLLILCLLAPAAAFATAQFSELLDYNGKTEKMFSEPLENYFSTGNPKPDMLNGPMCTACWRGYVGKWKIENGDLYLVSLHECCTRNPSTFPLEKIHPEWKSPVKATWYTGTLRIVQGRMLRYVHMGFQSKYERELYIRIEGGKVINENIIENTSPEERRNGN